MGSYHQGGTFSTNNIHLFIAFVYGRGQVSPSNASPPSVSSGTLCAKILAGCGINWRDSLRPRSHRCCNTRQRLLRVHEGQLPKDRGSDSVQSARMHPITLLSPACILVSAIAGQLEMDKEQVAGLRAAGLLHDIGSWLSPQVCLPGFRTFSLRLW